MVYYIFIAVFLLLVITVIWAMLAFHNVLANQRFLSSTWERIDRLMMLRNELIALYQEYWVRRAASPAATTHLQELLAVDAALHWEDIPARVQSRARVEEAAHALFAELMANPAVQQDQEFAVLRQNLAENTAALVQEVKRFNKTVTTYNTLLKQRPNTFTGRHFGAVAIDYFPIEFRAI